MYNSTMNESNFKVSKLTFDQAMLFAEIASDKYGYKIVELENFAMHPSVIGFAVDHDEQAIWYGWRVKSQVEKYFPERENFLVDWIAATEKLFPEQK